MQTMLRDLLTLGFKTYDFKINFLPDTASFVRLNAYCATKSRVRRCFTKGVLLLEVREMARTSLYLVRLAGGATVVVAPTIVGFTKLVLCLISFRFDKLIKGG